MDERWPPDVRKAQLKLWENSETNRQSYTIDAARLNPSIRFDEKTLFLDAASRGDVDEVKRLVLNEGVEINSLDVHGLTPLHKVY